MGRRKYGDREYDSLDKLKHENKRLKRQISALRKQVARIDINRYENLKDLLQKHDQEDVSEQVVKEQERLKKKWECHSCKQGTLKLKIFERRDGIFYFRKCDSCDNRTKTKKHDESVEGVKDEKTPV